MVGTAAIRSSGVSDGSELALSFILSGGSELEILFAELDDTLLVALLGVGTDVYGETLLGAEVDVLPEVVFDVSEVLLGNEPLRSLDAANPLGDACRPPIGGIWAEFPKTEYGDTPPFSP
ncbi:MAG: hypothetical protein RR087_01765 [Oscillospiraceae bacterium]